MLPDYLLPEAHLMSGASLLRAAVRGCIRCTEPPDRVFVEEPRWAEPRGAEFLLAEPFHAEPGRAEPVRVGAWLVVEGLAVEGAP